MKKNSKPTWTPKGKYDLFETFAVELQEFSETGKLPESCDRDMQYCMELQKERWEDKDLAVKFKFVPRGNFSDKSAEFQGYEDDKYKSKMYCRSCRFERKVYKGTRKVSSFKENRNLYQIITNYKNPEVMDNEEYVCPNCGAVSTIKGLIDGCDYCNTRFKMDELFPKVTNFHMLMDVGNTGKEIKGSVFKTMLVTALISFPVLAYVYHTKNGYDVLTSIVVALIASPFAGVMLGYILWCIAKIGSLFVAAHQSFDMMVGATGSGKKFETQMKEYSPEFSFTYFTGKVISMLRILMYAKDVQEVPFYTGELVGDLFSDIVDAHFRGALGLKKFEVEGDYCYVTVDAYMDVLHAKNSVRKKKEVFRLVLRRNVSKPLDVNFSISKIHCKSCGASFDATRQCNCPSCGTKYAVMDEDWVVMSVEKKGVVL